MCDHKLLVEKFNEHRKVHERFLDLFGTLLETAQNMKSLAADASRRYEDLFVQLRQEPLVRSPPEPPTPKRRKAHSFDSPSFPCSDAAAAGCAEVIDSSMVRNKSDPEVSYSLLNQNIDLPDSEESMFACSQSPTAREPLSPRRDAAENLQSTPPPRGKNLFAVEQREEKRFEGGKTRKKLDLSLGRFSTSFKMSPETTKQMKQLPMRPKMTTPKVKVELQENLAPVGKWTTKKTSNVGRTESTLRKTPTSVIKGNASLLNQTRLRQTKLRFTDNKSSADDDETYFDEFVQPSPTSFSCSRVMKSMKKKEQSSMIAAHSTAKVDNDDDVFQSPEPKARKPAKPAVDSDDDNNFDIDQTYFSEAEKDLSRRAPITAATKVKQEPSSQGKPSKYQILAMNTPAAQIEEPDMSGVEIVKPSQEIITIEESQPSTGELFMAAIHEEKRREQASRKTILDNMGPPPPVVLKPPENPFPFRFSPLRKFATFGGPSVAPPAALPERRCSSCTTHYQILEKRGLSPDVIRSKLARNCLQCRNAQLHDTPEGFWNPEISPTQES